MKITKEQFDALPDSTKALYVAEGDSYVVKPAELPDGSPTQEDFDALKRAKDREVQSKADFLKKLEAAEAEIAKNKQAGMKDAGDFDALESSYKEQMEKQKTDYESQLNGKDGHINKLLIDDQTTTLAAKLSKNGSSILKPHIKSRLTVDYVEGKPITRVKDIEGKPSAMSLNDLEKEFRENKEYAAIIDGSKASGGGADGGNGGGGGAKSLKDMSGMERVTMSKENPEQYKQMVAEQNKKTGTGY